MRHSVKIGRITMEYISILLENKNKTGFVESIFRVEILIALDN